MKQPVTLPARADLITLLNEEAYWKAQHSTHKLSKGVLELKKASDSLKSLAAAAERLSIPTVFYTPRAFLMELYALIIAAHQNDTKALPLYAKIKFTVKIRL